ncbi:MAG: metallophosphoesterase [Dehalococcoidia bacterium]|nr:metallophosphoesterase [Dehalococcoidia bacterium]
MSELTIAHSSDLHIDPPKADASDSFHPLCKVIAAARGVRADVLLLAGDIFDHNRLPLALLDRAARTLADAVPAYYCGSPDLAGTVNVVRMGAEAV